MSMVYIVLSHLPQDNKFTGLGHTQTTTRKAHIAGSKEKAQAGTCQVLLEVETDQKSLVSCFYVCSCCSQNSMNNITYLKRKEQCLTKKIHLEFYVLQYLEARPTKLSFLKVYFIVVRTPEIYPFNKILSVQQINYDQNKKYYFDTYQIRVTLKHNSAISSVLHL